MIQINITFQELKQKKKKILHAPKRLQISMVGTPIQKRRRPDNHSAVLIRRDFTQIGEINR